MAFGLTQDLMPVFEDFQKEWLLQSQTRLNIDRGPFKKTMEKNNCTGRELDFELDKL